VTVISEGMIPYALEFSVPEAKWRPSIPEADAEGKVPLGLNLAHIAIGDASILIDPGFDDHLAVVKHFVWLGVVGRRMQGPEDNGHTAECTENGARQSNRNAGSASCP
jgi:hypothetical protein